jgi:hypothetical protein
MDDVFANRLRYLPTPLYASAALFVVGALLGWLLDGRASAFGAMTGVGIVTLSYTMSVLVIAWADSIAPKLVLPFGMGVYIVKYTWIGMVMLVLASHEWAGLPALGFGVMAAVATWTGAQIFTVVRHGPHSARAQT